MNIYFHRYPHHLTLLEINKSEMDKIVETATIDPVPNHTFYYYEEANVVMLGAFSVIGVIGNAMILIVYWRLVRMTTTQFLVFVIAIFDFLTALIPVPISIIYKTIWFDIYNIYFCKIMFSSGILFIIPGTILLLMITIVRYCHVCRPYLLRWIEPKTKSLCTLAVLIGLFYSVLEAVISTNKNDSKHCKPVFDSYGIKIASNSKFAIPVLVILILIPLNISIIINNYYQKKTKMTYKTGINHQSVELIAQSGNDDKNKKLHSDSLNQFFSVVNENQSSNTGDYFKDINSESKESRARNKGDVSYKSTSSVSGSYFSRDKGVNESVITSIRSDTNSKGNKRPSIIIGNDVKNLEVSQYTIDAKPRHSVKKGGRSIDRWTDHSFKGLSRTTLMICVVCFVYILSYLPIAILFKYNATTLNDKYPIPIVKYLIIPLQHMFYLSCAANPIIYTFVNPGFRSQCRLLCKS